MSQTQNVTGHFDGHAIVLDQPLQLEPGRKLRLQIEPIESEDYPLTQISGLADDLGMPDLADRHTEYSCSLLRNLSDG